MYLLIISATRDLCVLKDFQGNPANPGQLGQPSPDPCTTGRGSGSCGGRRGGEPGRDPGATPGWTRASELLPAGTGQFTGLARKA